MSLSRLAVDLGTTNTVAVLWRAGHEPRSLLFDGSPLLPSGVYADPDGTLHTGRDAERLAREHPERYEPHPKRRVDEGAVLLGDTEVAVGELLAAVLRRVATEARGAVTDTVLTYPADWAQTRRAVLLDAAHRAGLPAVRLVAEPVAAATYCVEVLRQPVPPGRAILIFDFGGGTFDVAAVRRTPVGLEVLATGGLDDLGGLDVDAALAGHLSQLAALQAADGRELSAEVRAAKEMLSRTSSAPVRVPGHDTLHLTRDELERVAGPLVARAVDETRRVLERAGVEPAAVLLVGGSSRLPLVASRLHARLGVAATVPEQPELPVALGALRAVDVAPTSPAPSMRPRPLGPPPRPLGPPVSMPLTPPQPPRPAPPRARRRGRALLVAAIVIVVLVAVGWGAKGLFGLVSKGIRSAGSVTPGGAVAAGYGALTPVQDVAPAGGGAVGVAATAATVFAASVGQGRTDLVALPVDGAANAKERWRSSAPIEPVKVRVTAVADVVVVDGERSATDGGKNVRAVFDAGSGKLLWKALWHDRFDVGFVGKDVVVETRSPVEVQRVSLRTGATVWKRTSRDTILASSSRRAAPVLTWGSGPAAPPPLNIFREPEGAYREPVGTGADVVEVHESEGIVHVLDGATGKGKLSKSINLDDDHWIVFGGLVIGKLSSKVSPGRVVVVAHRLTDLGQAWKIDQPAGVTVERIRPCGERLVCYSTSGSAGAKLVAAQLADGKAAQTHALESSSNPWYALDNRLLVGQTFMREAKSLRPDGNPLWSAGKFEQTRAGDGPRVAITTSNGGDGWNMAIVETNGSGRRTKPVDVGKEQPESTVVLGSLLVVVTGEQRVKAWKIP